MLVGYRLLLFFSISDMTYFIKIRFERILSLKTIINRLALFHSIQNGVPSLKIHSVIDIFFDAYVLGPKANNFATSSS